jgi:hypothetical protein
VVFGAEFEKKCTPPTGTWVAMKFANLIDPALQSDVYADKPWLFSPMLCSMNILHILKANSEILNAAPTIEVPIGPKKKGDKQDLGSTNSVDLDSSTSRSGSIDLLSRPSSLKGPDKSYIPRKEDFHSTSSKAAPEKNLAMVGPWTWKDDIEMTEKSDLIHVQDPPPCSTDDPAERRKWFQKHKTRISTIFSPSHIYSCEVFSRLSDICTLY